MNISENNIAGSRAYAKKYKTAYAEWLCNQRFNVGLTLNWNTDVSLTSARQHVRNCFFRIDRHLLGSRFNLKRSQRTFGVFFFEHVTTNLHCHGLVRIAEPNVTAFFDLFPEDRGGVWTKVCKTGTYAVSKNSTPRAAAFYDLKEQHPSSDDRTALWLDEFYPVEG